MIMGTLKEKTINKIIEIEGGYVNDPDDSGGETKFGITKATARSYGYSGDMKDLPRSLAFAIYENRYWDALMLDEIEHLSVKIADEVADTAVNLGVGRAAEFLQRSLNVLNDRERYYNDLVVDGDVGRKTIAALKSYLRVRAVQGETVLYRMLNSLQGSFYVGLGERREKDERFMFGWFLNRVA